MKKLYALTIFAVAVLFCSNIYASTITLQPSIEGKDTYVDSGNSATNYGSYSSLYVWNNYHSSTTYSLIEFDLSIIPTNQNITNAVMKIYYLGGDPSTVKAYKITEYWDENNVTWNNQPTIDISPPVAITSYTLPIVTWNITDFVNEWYVAPLTNHGIEFRSSDYQEFFSSDSSYYPMLIIDYQQPVLVPEPTTILLLISGIGILFGKLNIR